MAAADPRFFPRPVPRSLAELVAACGATLPPTADPARRFKGVAGLDDAGPDDVAVLHNPRYAPALRSSRAGAVLLAPRHASLAPPRTVALVTDHPHAAWARVAAFLHPEPPLRAGVHPGACVDPAARVDPAAEIGPLAVVGAGAEIGPGCRIGPGAVIGPGVVLGPNCRIGALASLSHAILGRDVVIHSGARLGQDGFGFAITPAGPVAVPQLGRVIVGDGAEIGANATVDRGALGDTVVGPGSRLDNLVQVAHNVRLGRSCVVVAQAGISGSTTLGNGVQLGAQAGLVGHIRVGDGARIGAQAGVMSDVAAGVELVGSPALPVREFFRNVAVLRRLARRGPITRSVG